MTTFRDALQTHPAPKRLGDVALRFEPSMLIGETHGALRSLKPTVAWVVGIGATLFAIASLVRGDALEVPGLLGLVAGLAFVATVWLERVDKRRRAFIVNFATTSLRLDFVTPIAGQPKTLIVHFDGVKDLGFSTQADGHACLTVDFSPQPESTSVFREVMVASITEPEMEDAQRLHRVLKGAFGLGEVPTDSPLFDEDTFVDAGRGKPRSRR